jgi:hypothetical protein
MELTNESLTAAWRLDILEDDSLMPCGGVEYRNRAIVRSGDKLFLIRGPCQAENCVNFLRNFAFDCVELLEQLACLNTPDSSLPPPVAIVVVLGE